MRDHTDILNKDYAKVWVFWFWLTLEGCTTDALDSLVDIYDYDW